MLTQISVYRRGAIGAGNMQKCMGSMKNKKSVKVSFDCCKNGRESFTESSNNG